MTRILVSMAAIALSFCSSGVALAQMQPDHLTCFKVKTDKAFKSATVNLDTVLPGYDLLGCSVKPKAKYVCVPTDKSLTALVEGNPLPISGASNAEQTVCYSVKCPTPMTQTDTFSDQFGSHPVSGMKAALLCAPAVQGTVAPTTTSTTLPCIPSAEVCDGEDNDCNGMADDGLGQTSCGIGGCFRTVQNCVDGSAQSCTPGSPSAETCNSIDDNCDGVVDDGLGTLTCGTGSCERTVNACESGTPQNCVPGTPSTEVCNSIDDNCDGQTDEGLGNLSCGVGACQNVVPACVAGMSNVCVPGSPSSEVCDDGIDNNCNGSVDEGC